ncbi:substrate-binding domain-containing protein [Streptomyces carpinensis]|uniref:Substrate-binding domain-containing protein n=1 Tax=Streptomyces carpinensis TaxID=66369 RepID=A0ABV1VUQ6_9ACTN|nr:substrate-binding domain-containing protein [Streptomyces carpinensis]
MDLGTISDEVAQHTLNSALLSSEVRLSDQPEVIQEAIKRSSIKLTPKQLDTAFKCWNSTVCKLGDGPVTIGMPDWDATIQWHKLNKMSMILQAMTYPSVGKLMFTDGQNEMAKYQADIRSLASRGAHVIVELNSFGKSTYPANRFAQKLGAKVVTYISPQPDAPSDTITSQIHLDSCAMGKAMARIADQKLRLTRRTAIFNGVPGNPLGVEWNRCYEQAVKKSRVGVKLDTGWTPAGTFSAASAVVSSGKNYSAILFDYADPVPQVVDAFDKAAIRVPAIITWTDNNGLAKIWEKKQGTPGAFPLWYTTSHMWSSRASVTIGMASLAGHVPAEILSPAPFVQAKRGLYEADRPDDYPGSDVMIPDELLSRMLKTG